MPVGGRNSRIPFEVVGFDQVQQLHFQAVGQRQACDDIAVAGVVAATADHRDLPRLRPARAQLGKGRGPGAAHQLVAGNAMTVDRRAIEGTHLGGFEEGIFG